MKNTKRCPIGLGGLKHYCPIDSEKHEPLSKIRDYLENKFLGKTSFDIADEPWNAGHWETLQFIRNGCKGERPKTQLQAQASNPETTALAPEPTPTITPGQQKEMLLDDTATIAREQKRQEYLKRFAHKPVIPVSVAEAEKPAEITAAQREAMRIIQQLRKEQGYGAVSPGAETDEENLLSVWRSNPNVRAEFRSYEMYGAYVRARARGKVKIVGGKIIK